MFLGVYIFGSYSLTHYKDIPSKVLFSTFSPNQFYFADNKQSKSRNYKRYYLIVLCLLCSHLIFFEQIHFKVVGLVLRMQLINKF